jgi:ribonuclease P protein component
MKKKLSLSYKQKLFQHRKTIYKAAFFYIQQCLLESFNKKRFIIIISKKAGNSVTRNYLKRITKILLKKYIHIFHPNFTYFIIFHKIPLHHISFNILNDSFNNFRIKK